MLPAELFRFCPRCAAARPVTNIGRVPFECGACGLVYFFNPTVSACAWVSDPAGRALLIRRALDPEKGKFGVPGGFVDFGETAEQALVREVREEVGLEVRNIAFLATFTNHYPYREVTYPVVDLVFTADAVDPHLARALDGAAGIEWRHPADLSPTELAFPSIKESLLLIRR